VTMRTNNGEQVSFRSTDIAAIGQTAGYCDSTRVWLTGRAEPLQSGDDVWALSIMEPMPPKEGRGDG